MDQSTTSVALISNSSAVPSPLSFRGSPYLALLFGARCHDASLNDKKYLDIESLKPVMTIHQVAEVMNISASRVYQLESHALIKLRRICHQRGLALDVLIIEPTTDKTVWL